MAPNRAFERVLNALRDGRTIWWPSGASRAYICEADHVEYVRTRTIYRMVEAGMVELRLRGNSEYPDTVVELPSADPPNRPIIPFREEELGGAFDGFTVTSDADPGL